MKNIKRVLQPLGENLRQFHTASSNDTQPDAGEDNYFSERLVRSLIAFSFSSSSSG